MYRRRSFRLDCCLRAALTAAEKPDQGEIIAVGKGKVADDGKVRPLDVKVGDVVVFGKYAGSDTITIDGEELVILSESDIKAVLV